MQHCRKRCPTKYFCGAEKLNPIITLLTGFKHTKMTFLLKLLVFSVRFSLKNIASGKMAGCWFVRLIVFGSWFFKKLLVLWHLTSPSVSLLTSECFLSSLSFKVYRPNRIVRVLMFFVMSYIVRSYIDRVLKLEHVQSIWTCFVMSEYVICLKVIVKCIAQGFQIGFAGPEK